MCLLNLNDFFAIQSAASNSDIIDLVKNAIFIIAGLTNLMSGIVLWKMWTMTQTLVPGKTQSTATIRMEEMLVNIPSEDEYAHSLGMKFDLELFEAYSTRWAPAFGSPIRHTIILTSLEQDSNQLLTVAGKLYYKEKLVSRINEYFHQPMVRDLHFASFMLQ